MTPWLNYRIIYCSFNNESRVWLHFSLLKLKRNRKSTSILHVYRAFLSGLRAQRFISGKTQEGRRSCVNFFHRLFYTTLSKIVYFFRSINKKQNQIRTNFLPGWLGGHWKCKDVIVTKSFILESGLLSLLLHL